MDSCEVGLTVEKIKNSVKQSFWIIQKAWPSLEILLSKHLGNIELVAPFHHQFHTSIPRYS